MLKYIFKIAMRNLIRQKYYSLIDMLGITLAISSSLFVFIYSINEYNFDKHFPESEKIFRLEKNNGIYFSGVVCGILKNAIPEISYTTNINPLNTHSITFSEGKNTVFGKIYQSDKNYLNIFDLDILSGNIKAALSDKHKVAINKSTALSLFGRIDVIGEEIKLNHTFTANENVIIEAVYSDLPKNSSLKPIGLYSLNNNLDLYSREYESYSIFIKINNTEDINHIREKINQTLIKENLLKSDCKITLSPLTGLHFSEHIDNDYIATGDKTTSNVLILIGILILVISIVNSMILNARNSENQTQLIYLLIGAGKIDLRIIKFIERLTICFFSGIISIILFYLFINNSSNNLINYNFSQTSIVTVFLFVFTTSSVISILIIQKLEIPTINLTSHVQESKSRFFSITVQYSISIILIICSLFIYKQKDFLLKFNTGLTSKQIISLNLNTEISKNLNTFKHEINSHNQIIDVTFASNDITHIETNLVLINEREVKYGLWMVDNNFLDFFNIKIVNGSNFTYNYETQKYKCILNHSAVNQYKPLDKIGEVIPGLWRNSELLGVCKDFNYASLHNKIEPLCFILNRDYCNTAYIKFKRNPEIIIKYLRNTTNKLYPNIPFKYSFLDDTFKNLYQAENSLLKLITTICIIAIFISSIGFHALVVANSQKRIKEIGIRKVNGAKVFEILTLLNKDLIKWIAIAFVIACPIAYYAMSLWLENFAYKTELSWWIFALAGLLALSIALLTVSWQSWRAATRNPVEALKYE